MLDIFFERFRQKKRTAAYPATLPALPPRFRGRPFIDARICASGQGRHCGYCCQACPVGAISLENGAPALDMGICTFCGACAKACPEKSLVFTNDWRLATTEREALIVRAADYIPAYAKKASPVFQTLPEQTDRGFILPELPVEPTREAAGTFARSFRLRQVTAAGCGACEADLNVLGTIVFDLSRFGMDFVASPRHADGLILTGPIPRNMVEALLKCRNAMPSPSLVIAVGACAISGGLFRADVSPETPPLASNQYAEGALPHVPVDLFIPGCPPHPYTILDGLLRFIGRNVPSICVSE